MPDPASPCRSRGSGSPSANPSRFGYLKWQSVERHQRRRELRSASGSGTPPRSPFHFASAPRTRLLARRPPSSSIIPLFFPSSAASAPRPSPPASLTVRLRVPLRLPAPSPPSLACICFSYFSYCLVRLPAALLVHLLERLERPAVLRQLLVVQVDDVRRDRVSRKSRSCDTTSSVFFHRIRYSSSQITARQVEVVRRLVQQQTRRLDEQRARERDAHAPPPGEGLGGVVHAEPLRARLLPSFDSGTVNPRPWRIFAARASAVASPFSSSRSYVLFSWSLRSNVILGDLPGLLRARLSPRARRCMPLPLSASSLTLARRERRARARPRASCAEPSSPPFSSARATALHRGLRAPSSALRKLAAAPRPPPRRIPAP